MMNRATTAFLFLFLVSSLSVGTYARDGEEIDEDLERGSLRREERRRERGGRFRGERERAFGK